MVVFDGEQPQCLVHVVPLVAIIDSIEQKIFSSIWKRTDNCFLTPITINFYWVYEIGKIFECMYIFISQLP